MINESNNLITIQDLLPHLPKFTKIGNLKPIIVEFLQRHKNRINGLQASMKEATDIASEIRDKQERLKNRTTVVKPSDVCAHCLRSLSGRAFHVHSCRHSFHRECLETAMMPFLAPDRIAKLQMLVGEETRLLSQWRAEQQAGSKGSLRTLQEKYDKVAGFISHILGTDCPLCGNIAIS